MCEPQVVSILGRALPKHPLESFELLTEGLRNLNYRLRVRGLEDTFVLRMYGRDPAACQKEIDLHRLVSGSVPVPEILYADPTGNHDIGPHAMLRWIDGVTFRQLRSRRNPPDIAQAAYSMGATLARIASFTYAQKRPFAAGGASLRMEGMLRARLGDFMAKWEPAISALSHKECLVHGDFSSRNIILDRSRGIWAVAGILDWELAFSGSPMWDIGSLLRYERSSAPLMEPHFSHGFRENGGSLPDNWREMSRTLDVLSLTESLSNPELPEDVSTEIVELITATLANSTWTI